MSEVTVEVMVMENFPLKVMEVSPAPGSVCKDRAGAGVGVDADTSVGMA